MFSVLSLSFSLSLSVTHTRTHTSKVDRNNYEFWKCFGSHGSENFHLANRLSNQHRVLAVISNCPSAVLDRLTDALLYHDTHYSRWPPVGHISSNDISLLKLHSELSLAHGQIAIQRCLSFLFA